VENIPSDAGAYLEIWRSAFLTSGFALAALWPVVREISQRKTDLEKLGR
jgi:hypothetical protein